MSSRTLRSKSSRSQRALRLLVAVATVAVAGPTVIPEVAGATSVDEAKRRVDQVVTELERLAERSDKLTEDYAEAVDRKNGLDIEIAVAEREVAVLSGELDTLRSDMSAVAVRAFTGAGTDVLGPLFTSASAYNDSLQRDQYSRVALSVGTTTADDFDAKLGDLEAAKASLERKRNEADSLSVQISAALDEAETLRIEYQQRRARAEAEYGRAVEAEEQRRAEESFRRMQAEAAAAQQADQQQAAQQQTAQQQSSSGGGSSSGSSGAAPAPAPSSGGGGSSAPAPAAPAPPPPPAQYPQPSSLAQVAVNAALSQQGVPYRFATSIPGVNFDCSGLTHYAWGQAGVYLPRNSRAQFASTPRVPSSEARPGDLIYFYNPISHVGLYIGNGQMVHAPNTGSVVHIRSVNWSRVVGVTRPGV
jgi:cell wall-associated NlpC family hydrolase